MVSYFVEDETTVSSDEMYILVMSQQVVGSNQSSNGDYKEGQTMTWSPHEASESDKPGELKG